MECHIFMSIHKRSRVSHVRWWLSSSQRTKLDLLIEPSSAKSQHNLSIFAWKQLSMCCIWASSTVFIQTDLQKKSYISFLEDFLHSILQQSSTTKYENKYFSKESFVWLLTWKVSLDKIVDFLAEWGRNRQSTERNWYLTQTVLISIVDKPFINCVVCLSIATLTW